MTAVTIDVTQADIDAGCELRDQMKHDGGNCPLTRAVTRALPGLPYPWVTRHKIQQDGPDSPLAAELPPVATSFIERFDGRWGDLEPFSFQVDVADRYLTAPAVTS